MTCNGCCATVLFYEGGSCKLPLPVVNFDLVPKERPLQYEGVPGLEEDGSYATQKGEDTCTAIEEEEDDENVTF